jgi:Protein of unknown function (DUF3306)
VSEDSGNRLSRWSQRKLAARRGEAVDEAPRDERKPDAPAAPAVPTADADTAAAEAAPDLPPIEELTRDSDYSVFLAKNVPESLRREALRKLWRSDPVFANLDGLNDYCEDFNVTDTAITMAQTAYKVGKGYFDEIEGALEKAEASAQEPAESAAGSGQDRTHKNDSHAAADDDDTAAAHRVGKSDSGGSVGGQSEDGA